LKFKRLLVVGRNNIGSSTTRIGAARHLLGLEGNGATYRRAATTRNRDKLRQMILEGRGWKLHRVCSTDWWHDANSEMEKLVGVLNAVTKAKEL
jgi:very-short-patch-repair endonuclease